jgi:hypothetical protein
MNLEMSQAVREKLGEETDSSLAEVIRRSLAVFNLLWTERKKGGSLLIRSPEGEKEVVIV